MSSCKLINIFACAAFDFLTADRELEHDATVLAFFLTNLGRGNFIDSLAPGALYLLWAGDELKHRSAVVADKVGAGHWRDTCCD